MALLAGVIIGAIGIYAAVTGSADGWFAGGVIVVGVLLAGYGFGAKG